VKGDKIVAFCDRHCNVIAPFVSAPGNRNESPLLREALPLVTRIANAVALTFKNHRQLGWRLRLPDESESHFQSWNGSQYQRESSR